MFAADATSREAYDTAEAALGAARAQIAALDAQIQQAEAAVDRAQVSLGYTRITAPIRGTVVAVITEEGQTVNSAQLTSTIVVLAQLDVMKVKAEISEADVTRVRLGQMGSKCRSPAHVLDRDPYSPNHTDTSSTKMTA